MNNDSPAMPRLLVSVRDAEEVLAALAGGADWIDLKEPNAGALAGVEVEVAREAVEALAGRRPLSAALGELRDWSASPTSGLLNVAGIGVVKLGLAGCARLDDWQQQWQAVAEDAATTEKQLVAAIYADWQQAEAPRPAEILEIAQQSGSRYLLIDTFDKRAGSTFDYLSPADLAQIFCKAKQGGMTTVLAGSLSPELLGQVPSKAVDLVAVRGAVCRGERTSRVEARLVEDFLLALALRFGDSPVRPSVVD